MGGDPGIPAGASMSPPEALITSASPPIMLIPVFPHSSVGKESACNAGEMATHSSILAWRIAWTIVHGVAKSRTGLSGFHFHFTVFPVEATPLCFQGSGSQKQQVSHARSVCSGCLGWGCKLSTTSQGVSATGVPVHFDLCWLQTAEDGRPGRTPPPLPGACPCISPSC